MKMKKIYTCYCCEAAKIKAIQNTVKIEYAKIDCPYCHGTGIYTIDYITSACDDTDFEVVL